MPNPSQFDVIKPEVRGLSAYTLKHFDAEVKLDQNENPYELPADLKREIASLGLFLGDARVRVRLHRPSSALSQKLIDLDLEIRNALALPLSAGMQVELRRLTALLRAIDPH